MPKNFYLFCFNPKKILFFSVTERRSKVNDFQACYYLWLPNLVISKGHDSLSGGISNWMNRQFCWAGIQLRELTTFP